jgi:hypothetical protein
VINNKFLALQKKDTHFQLCRALNIIFYLYNVPLFTWQINSSLHILLPLESDVAEVFLADPDGGDFTTPFKHFSDDFLYNTNV